MNGKGSRHARRGTGGRRAAANSRGALHALTTSALTLTGVANQALADAPADRYTAEYNYSEYTEDSISAAKTNTALSSERYEVEMHQFRFRGPVPFTDRFDFGVEIVSESMSGASPMHLEATAGLQPVQALSGPSISDERLDLLGDLSYYMDGGRLGAGLGFSDENDYSSINFAFDGDWYFNEKNTTLSGGIGFSFDEITPTDPQISPTRPTSEEKDDLTFFVALSQVIGRDGIVQGGLTYKLADGYLSDPYKQMLQYAPVVFLPDSRPDSRSQLAWTLKYRQYVEEVDGTTHIDYQYFSDDWGIQSHTFEASFHKAFWHERLTFSPMFRYYTQTEADFFVPFFLAPSPQTEFSNDYRLSAYGALTLGFKLTYDFRLGWFGNTDFRLTWAYERYKSTEDFALETGTYEHPGLVDYDVWTVGVGVKF